MLFHDHTGRRIKSINEKFERIIKDQSGFGLITAASAGGDCSTNINRQTDPLLEPNIVGMQIENDTSHLVSLLMTEYRDGDRVPAVQIVAIIGMGGIGKTTLAQKVYNHPTIRDNFRMPPPMWVCVSQDYSDIDLLKEVIRCAGGDHSRAQSLSELKLLLAEVIEQKKFLLILDDIWSARVWEDLLRKPLQKAAVGSRILITTRNENVAKLMGAMYLHLVQLLPVKDGWSLLCKKVLQGGADGGIEAVEDIGVQIVNKCGGLPLAIKTIAGVLMVKDRTRQEWESVLNNPAWSLTELPDGVMGAMYLSYQDLPFHLKQCFIYCSLFPEDARIHRTILAQHWIAHGFVEGGDMMEMEEVARGYYKELVRRNLLQPDPQCYDYTAYIMHDLLRTLAQFLAGDENFTGVEGLVVKVSASTKLRHLCLIDNDLNSFPDVLKDCESLRTLHLESNSLMDVPLDLFKKLRQLRILKVSCMNVKRLPESLHNLVHLRIVDLSFSSITDLPETIANLSNLQQLILYDCPNMHKLPKGVTELYNLRGLNILKTPVNGLPAGIGRLQRLSYMLGFVTNGSFDGRRVTRTRSHQDGWCCMEELRFLPQLKVLTIMNIERAVAMVKARGFLLKDKRHLIYLQLNCTPSGDDGQPYGHEEVKRIQEMYEEELHPPNSLEILKIRGFFGLQFPSWMMGRSSNSQVLLNLRWLELVNCRLCKQLPPLGQLPNLDYLGIKGAAAVETVGPEFFGWAQPSSYIPFPKLEKLELEDFPNWVDWMWESEDGAMAMPCLQKLKLSSCPKLRSLPKGLLGHTNLDTLNIEGANSLTTVENLVCVKTMKIKENTNLVRLSNLPALQELIVESCPALRDMGILCSLKILVLRDLAMQSLPEWLILREGEQQPFPALDKFEILVGGVHVLQGCLEGSPDWPKIQHFSSVHIKVNGKPESLSYTRDPCSFNINMGADGSDIGHHN